MARKLTTVVFYEKVSEILSDYQDNILTEANAELKLERLIAQAKQDGLEINMSVGILHAIKQNQIPAKETEHEDEACPDSYKIMARVKNRFKETIRLFSSLMKKEQRPYLQQSYQRHIDDAEKILKLIKEDKMNPSEFDKLPARDKWDIANSKLLKNVIWACNKCGLEQGKEPPHANIFAGDSVHCGKCNNMLTMRTGGGQNNPFNMTFKDKFDFTKEPFLKNNSWQKIK